MVIHNGIYKTIIDEINGLFLLEDSSCHVQWVKESEIEIC